MDILKSRQVADAFLRQGGATSEDVAKAVARVWGRIDEALAPIVGSGGVAALYYRSIHVCAREHAVLLQALGPSQRTLDTDLLRNVLRAQPPETAATQGAELLQTFHELLSRMVGPSLTDRLLRSIWDDIEGDAPAEDPTP